MGVSGLHVVSFPFCHFERPPLPGRRKSPPPDLARDPSASAAYEATAKHTKIAPSAAASRPACFGSRPNVFKYVCRQVGSHEPRPLKHTRVCHHSECHAVCQVSRHDQKQNELCQKYE
jgi:hypothetical protein